MAKLWVRGAKEYDEMDEIDKYRYESLLTWWLILHENIFYQWRNGLLDNNSYKSWAKDLEFFVKQKNLNIFWDRNSSYYQREFADHVSELIEKYAVAPTP